MLCAATLRGDPSSTTHPVAQNLFRRLQWDHLSLGWSWKWPEAHRLWPFGCTKNTPPNPKDTPPPRHPYRTWPEASTRLCCSELVHWTQMYTKQPWLDLLTTQVCRTVLFWAREIWSKTGGCMLPLCAMIPAQPHTLVLKTSSIDSNENIWALDGLGSNLRLTGCGLLDAPKTRRPTQKTRHPHATPTEHDLRLAPGCVAQN